MSSEHTIGHKLHKRALLLSYFTVGYNILEGIVSVAFGQYGRSIALVGFGLDSFIESLSGIVMIWRFRHPRTASPEQEERIERKALRLVATTMFVLGAYVLYESTKRLLFHEPPEPGIAGIIIALISLIVMPVLFFLKRTTAVSLGSISLTADAKQTPACVFMSFSLLIGVSLTYLFGLWYADPLVGLLIAMFLAREGYEALKEKRLCTC